VCADSDFTTCSHGPSFEIMATCSSKDCNKDLKVKAKQPLTEFLAVIKETLADLPKEAGKKEGLRIQLLHMRGKWARAATMTQQQFP